MIQDALSGRNSFLNLILKRRLNLKKEFLMRTLHKFSPLVLVTLFLSCGGSGGGGGSSDKGASVKDGFQNETVMVDGSNVNGIYATPLWSLNYNLHVPEVGQVAVSRFEDEFKARVKLNIGPRNTNVRQGIYYGRRCPELKDDINKDAYIDAKEAKVAMGLMTIPLDGDLNSQEDGLNNFPYGRSRNGSYDYQETASFEALFRDLKGIETDFTDDIMKIMPTEGITLPGRVVLVMGIEEDYILPPTVQGEYGMSAHESLPIACGVLWKVKKMPAGME